MLQQLQSCPNCAGRSLINLGRYTECNDCGAKFDKGPDEELGSYAAMAAGIGQLVETKQKVYGDSFNKAGQLMAILYPNGISTAQMTDALCVVRILDKLFRIATDRDALGESPYGDIVGYGLLGLRNAKRGEK